MSSTPELSVLICSRNGATSLPATIAALHSQTLPRSRFEVIVVDDGSTDSTAAVADGLGARVVRLPGERGLAAARNAGVRAAAADVIAFTDDDCAPEPGWCRALTHALADPAVDGVGGKVVPVCARPFLGGYLLAHNPLAPLPAELLDTDSVFHRLRRYLRTIILGDPELAAGTPLYSPVGANMALRRELLYDLGGFDENLRFGMEEEELCLRAHARPQRTLLRYEPRAVVRHHFRPDLRDGLRRSHAYGRGHALAGATHDRLRPIVYPVPVLEVAALAMAFSRRRPLLALAPPLAYGRWMTMAWRSRSAAPVAYACLQLSEEVATMLGELRGWFDGYASSGRRPQRL